MIGMSTSFGRSGIQDWWLQRISAVYLFIYVLVLSYLLITVESVNYASWSALFAPTWMKVLTFVASLFIAIHAWVGLWIVSTDYLKPVVIRNLFQAVVLIISLSIVIWTGMILWG